MRAWAPPGYDVERWPTLAPCLVLVKCPARERFAEWRNNLPIAQSAETSNPVQKRPFRAMAQSMLGSYWREGVQQRRGPMHPKKFSAARVAVMLSLTGLLAPPARAGAKKAPLPPEA